MNVPLPRRLLFIALLFVLLTASCAPTRQGVSWADLSLVGERQDIMVAYNNFIVIVDPATGRPIQLRNSEGQIRNDNEGNPLEWEVEGNATGSQFFSSPIWLDDSTLLVADYNEKLLQVDFQRADVITGSPIELPGHVITDPALYADTVIIPFTERDVAAYEMTNYDQVWNFETGRGVWASPLVVDDRVYVPSMDHHLYAVDAETGDEIWKLDLGGALASSPVVYGDKIYIGSFDRKLYEISLEGEILSEFETNDWIWSSPVVFQDILYTGDMSGNVYALDPQNSLSAVWQVHPASKGIRGQPLVTDEYIVVGDRDGNVIWLDRTSGEEITRQQVDAEILSDIILVEPNESLSIPDPLVVVSTVKNNKILVAFTLDGVPRWTYGR